MAVRSSLIENFFRFPKKFSISVGKFDIISGEGLKKMIIRPQYIAWLDEFRDKKLIKVLTGLRRSGKSTILEMYEEKLRQSGISDERIISFNFELFENEPYLDPHMLHQEIVSRIQPGATLYVFLDEIQHVPGYEKVLDSLYAHTGVDVYVTGSTADLLSSEIATRLTGRYVEINVLPLSFREYASARTGEVTSERRLFMDYITFGGMPGAMEFPMGSSAQREYIENVFKTIVEKDVLKRGGKGRFLVERIIRYLTDTVGSLTSPKRIVDRLDERRMSDGAESATYNTVTSYIERLADCFFVYKAPRFDVRGGENLKLINKFYLTDFGFKYYILNNPKLELQQLVEDVVYLELLRRRYKVATGKVDDREVDFVVQGNDGRTCYIQVAVSVADEDKLNQELAPFAHIDDNYPRYIMTMDEVYVQDHAGVRTINIIDFLLGRTEL